MPERSVHDLIARTVADAASRAEEYATPLLRLEHAGVRFGDVQALRDIGLTLHRGERLALVGANGSGKTTLLRVLHGLVPFEGRREVVSLQGRLPLTAMLFQRPFLLSLSVRWNVLLGLWLHGVPSAQRAERCARALLRVGLEPLADRPARALSGGQQQRLALARAWALEPDILLLDEPTANLDPSAKREVERLIDDLADDGVTVVMSTHNLGQAKRLATRVAYLEGGRLVVDLPVDRFFNDALPQRSSAIPQRRVAVAMIGRRWALALAAALCMAAPAWPQDKFIVMASTTSTEQSGLFGHLLPLFKQATGIDVRVVAVGTGQALDTGAARRCRRRVRARHGGRGEVRRRRLRAQALAGDVQRLRAGRPGRRPGQGQGQRHRGGAGQAAVDGGACSSRAATRAARTRPSCGCGRRPASTWRRPNRPATRNAAAAWARR